MERSILHMDLDTFFVSVERLMDSRLNNRPIIIGGTGDRGVVAACSYETRKFGVHSAMPVRMARELCPEAIIMVIWRRMSSPMLSPGFLWTVMLHCWFMPEE